MNLSNSECSSGCESGWTMYLDQLSNSTDPYYNNNYNVNNYYNYGEKEGAEINQEDEGLSMVSDASSGPPTRYNVCYENYGYAYAPAVNCEEKNKSKRKNKSKETLRQKNLCLDDTASSPVSRYNEDNVAPTDSRYSMGNVPGNFSREFCSQNFEGESVKKKQLSFFKSSAKGKSGSFLGRKKV